MTSPSFVLSILFVWALQLCRVQSLGLSTATGTSTVATTEASSRVSLFSEIFIDRQSTQAAKDDADATTTASSIGQRLLQGVSIVQLHNLVARDECQFLVQACLAAAQRVTPTRELDKPGLVRLPTTAAAKRAAATKTPCADPLPPEIDACLHTILQRAARVIDEQLPSIAATLFDTDSLFHLLTITTDSHHSKDGLKFSAREPAINIYTSPGGEFLPHKDAQALTVLLPLSCPHTDFTGGGTAFWSQNAHSVDDATLVVKPEVGTALLFGGCVTHAGVAVKTGSRVVFVASFGRRQQDGSGKLHVIQEHRDIYGDLM